MSQQHTTPYQQTQGDAGFSLFFQYFHSILNPYDSLELHFIMEVHREMNHFIRNRKLSMFQVIIYLLYTTKASMFQNISNIRDELETLKIPSVSKQAVSILRGTWTHMSHETKKQL